MRVLLVDDEEELILTLAERLELRGFDVDATSNGTDALERIGQVAYDVVVVDVKMPGMSGEVLLTVIRQTFPDLPVILLTGHAGGDDDLAEAQRQEACAQLYKPVNIDELISTMRRCTGQRADG